jgi:hypothetical protein
MRKFHKNQPTSSSIEELLDSSSFSALSDSLVSEESVLLFFG